MYVSCAPPSYRTKSWGRPRRQPISGGVAPRPAYVTEAEVTCSLLESRKRINPDTQIRTADYCAAVEATRLCSLRAERHYVFVLFYCFYQLECHSRSQWSSGSMSDCSARGPGIESRCGQMCLSHNHCDLQPWARALYTLPAVPRSTQPSSYVGW